MGFDGNNWVNLSPQEKNILGPSNTTTDGSVEYGSLTGMEAATAICKAPYPNDPSAHFYSAEEIDKAIANGNVNGISTNTKFWIVIHIFDGFNANNSANNNCFSFLIEGISYWQRNYSYILFSSNRKFNTISRLVY